METQMFKRTYTVEKDGSEPLTVNETIFKNEFQNIETKFNIEYDKRISIEGKIMIINGTTLHGEYVEFKASYRNSFDINIYNADGVNIATYEGFIKDRVISTVMYMSIIMVDISPTECAMCRTLKNSIIRRDTI